MLLYMKQKVFSFKDRFTVTDRNGEARYFVEGKLISMGKKLTVSDAAGNEVAFVRQKVLTLLPKFFVEINGEEVAAIKKKLTFLKPKYEVEGLDWTVEGDFFAHDYSILENGEPIASIHKKWMSWGDSFELNISDSANEVIALAVILAIDAVMDAAASASASASSSSN